MKDEIRNQKANQLIMTLNGRFIHVEKEGIKVFTDSHTFSYLAWNAYLSVFDEIILCLRSKKESLEPVSGYEVTGNRVRAYILPYYEGPWQFIRKYFQLRKQIKHLIEYDMTSTIICRVPCPIGFITIGTLQKGRPYGVEVIGDPWDAFSPLSVRHILRPIFRVYFAYKLRRACRKATAARYVTETFLQRRYPCYGLSISASDIVLDKKDFIQSPRKHHKKDKYRLIYVGTLYQLYKGQDVLIKAVGKCAREGFNVYLDILGEGSYRKYLEELAKELGVCKRVRFHGMVNKDKVIEMLDQADLFVLPSRTEGLPRAMIEAMARALPCIGSNVGGIPELLDPEDMVHPGDENALAEKIMETLSDPQRMNIMSYRNLEKSKKYRYEMLLKRRVEFLDYIKQKTEEWTRR